MARTVFSSSLMSIVRLVLDLKPKFLLFLKFCLKLWVFIFSWPTVTDVMLLISLPPYIIELFFSEPGNFKIRILCLKGTNHWLTSALFILDLRFMETPWQHQGPKFLRIQISFIPYSSLEKITSTKNSLCLKYFLFVF